MTNTHFYMYACVSLNFALLSLLRAFGDRQWINGKISESKVDTWLMISSLVLFAVNLLAIRFRAAGRKMLPMTRISTTLTVVKFILVGTVAVKNMIKYPPTKYVYIEGGIAALCSTTIALLASGLLFSLDIRKNAIFLSPEQRNYEFSSFILTFFLVVGAFIFQALEPWNFEKASEFCLMTLLTIGYGDIVPTTDSGRIAMIFYTSFGLCVATYYLLSFEDLQLQLVPENQLDSKLALLDGDEYKDAEKEALCRMEKEIFDRAGRTLISTGILAVIWLFGFSLLFHIAEKSWSYFDAFYFSFVTMTAIGFGDYQVSNAISRELWWLFLFNAVSILTYIITISGKLIAIKTTIRNMENDDMSYVSKLATRFKKFQDRKLKEWNISKLHEHRESRLVAIQISKRSLGPIVHDK